MKFSTIMKENMKDFINADDVFFSARNLKQEINTFAKKCDNSKMFQHPKLKAALVEYKKFGPKFYESLAKIQQILIDDFNI